MLTFPPVPCSALHNTSSRLDGLDCACQLLPAFLRGGRSPEGPTDGSPYGPRDFGASGLGKLAKKGSWFSSVGDSYQPDGAGHSWIIAMWFVKAAIE
jgi:hypothetical protein